MKREARPSQSLFDLLFNDASWLDPWQTPALGRGFPRIDVSETETEVKVMADVPGVNPDHLEIDLEGDRMRISGYIEEERREGERPYRYERAYGEFRREFALPSRVNEEQVKAVCRNGVLTVTLPKAAEAKRRPIKIETP